MARTTAMLLIVILLAAAGMPLMACALPGASVSAMSCCRTVCSAPPRTGRAMAACCASQPPQNGQTLPLVHSDSSTPQPPLTVMANLPAQPAPCLHPDRAADFLRFHPGQSASLLPLHSCFRI